MADSTNQDDSKRPWLSKTIVTNVLIAASTLYPPAALWIAAHGIIFSLGMSVLNIVLRSVSEKKIDLSIPGMD